MHGREDVGPLLHIGARWICKFFFLLLFKIINSVDKSAKKEYNLEKMKKEGMMTDIQMQNTVKLFRRRISFFGGAMIFLTFLTNTLFLLQSFICTLIVPFLNDIGYEVFYSLTYGLTYLLSFIIPAILLQFTLKEDIYPTGYKAAKTSKGAGLFALFILGTIYCCSLINSYLMSFLFIFFGQPNIELFETSFHGVHSIFLEFLTMAIIPGLCEEILFRGVFLKKMLPFGKNLAVVISAVFFALMHQMPLQFLYTFAAGLMLGYLFIYTGSIWWGVLVHTLNNAISVLVSVFEYYFDERSATIISYAMYALLAVAAIVSLSVLVCRKGKEQRTRESVFGKTEPVHFVDGEHAIERGTAIKAFFTPVTIVFLAIYFSLTMMNFILLYS